MSIRVKTYPPETLCTKCKNGITVEGVDNQTRIRCWRLDATINFPVVRCSHFVLRGTESRESLEKIAWILDTSPRQIGFIRPGSEKHREVTHRDYDD